MYVRTTELSPENVVDPGETFLYIFQYKMMSNNLAIWSKCNFGFRHSSTENLQPLINK